jgi:hypothetical protein
MLKMTGSKPEWLVLDPAFLINSLPRKKIRRQKELKREWFSNRLSDVGQKRLPRT